MKRSLSGKLVSLLCSAALTASLVPSVAFAQPTRSVEESAAAVHELLQTEGIQSQEEPASDDLTSVDADMEPADANPREMSLELLAEDEDPYEGAVFRFVFPIQPVIKSITQTYAGLRLMWDPIPEADGYIILRRVAGSGAAVDDLYRAGLSGNTLTINEKLLSSSAIKKTGWVKPKTVTNPAQISWIDTGALAGVTYEYLVQAYVDTEDSTLNNDHLFYMPSWAEDRSLSLPSQPVQAFRVPTPVMKSTSQAGSKLTVNWTPEEQTSGYQIQYARNSLFMGKKTITLSGARKASATISGLTSSVAYFVRMRAYKKIDGEKHYSPWVVCGRTSGVKTASISRLSYKAKVKQKVKTKTEDKKEQVTTVTKTQKKVLELRARAGQLMFGYDTVQGSCSDGTYAYFCLYNRSAEKCRIAKMRLSDCKMIKVSAVLPIHHGNDITYNSRSKKLVVSHATVTAGVLTEVSPSTLKVVRKVTPTRPAALQDATVAQLNAMSEGYVAIAYCESKDQYVALLRNSHNMVVMDSSYNVLRYIKPSAKNGQTYQNLECTDEYILLSESFGYGAGKSYNLFTTYTWEGQKTSTVRLTQAYELESIFFAGKTLYGSFYRAYAVKGKTMRDNYVYKITKY